MESLLSDSPNDAATLLDVAGTLARLDTDAERLLALDILGESSEDAASAYVDDLKLRLSSPWALLLACNGLSHGASHLGMVYECGETGKTTATFEGIPDEALHLAPLLLHGSVQGGSPRILHVKDDNAFLGVPDGLPPLRSDATQHVSPSSMNQAVRLRILRNIGQRAAIALRVAAVQALRCPWPLLARRYYLARGEAKLSYLLPFVIASSPICM